ncbi:MAG: hypothetical protein QHC40_02220 [Sphingobium sp.]|nr:hypothetical protein [Sphingobium sp.]
MDLQANDIRKTMPRFVGDNPRPRPVRASSTGSTAMVVMSDLRFFCGPREPDVGATKFLKEGLDIGTSCDVASTPPLIKGCSPHAPKRAGRWRKLGGGISGGKNGLELFRLPKRTKAPLQLHVRIVRMPLSSLRTEYVGEYATQLERS